MSDKNDKALKDEFPKNKNVGIDKNAEIFQGFADKNQFSISTFYSGVAKKDIWNKIWSQITQSIPDFETGKSILFMVSPNTKMAVNELETSKNTTRIQLKDIQKTENKEKDLWHYTIIVIPYMPKLRIQHIRLENTPRVIPTIK